jgi:hypothetical protein
MKKNLLVFSAFAFIFSSCSSSGSDPVTPVTPLSGILVSKTIETRNGSVITDNYNYSGNKLLTITRTGGSDLFTYLGDLITKIESFKGTTLDTSGTMAYNSGGKLISSVFITYDITGVYGNKTDYTYLANGDITFINYTGNATSQTIVDHTGKVFFTNGEVSKLEQYFPASIGTTAHTDITNYTYDSKNNPFINITGYSKIAFNYESPNGFTHNIMTDSQTSIYGNSNTSTTFTYNTSNFPTNGTSIRTSPNGTGGTTTSTSSIQYFY